MGALEKTVQQRDNLNTAIYLELENIIPKIRELVEVRRKYAQHHMSSKQEDDKYYLSANGINFCDLEMCKLLGINIEPLKIKP